MFTLIMAGVAWSCSIQPGTDHARIRRDRAIQAAHRAAMDV